LITLPPRDAKTPVKVVPMFAHIMMAADEGKSIIHALIAAKVMTPTALLDWIIAVTTNQTRKKSGNQP